MTRVVAAAGVPVVGVLCWLAVRGNSALAAVLVTVGALVVLVGGGNLLSGRSPHGAGLPRRSEQAPPSAEERGGEPG